MVVGLGLVLCLATLALFLRNRPVSVPASWGVSAGPRDSLPELAGALALLAFYLLPGLALGALVLRRHPRHPIGWLLLSVGLASITLYFVQELTITTHFARPPSSAGAGWAVLAAASAWTLNVVWVLVVTPYLWLVSVFPDGRLPSHRWRWLHLSLLMFALPLTIAVLSESPMHSAFGLPNPMPIYLPGGEATYNLLFGVGVLSLLVTAAGVIALVVNRFRRAQGEERQQFKWLALSAGAGAGFIILGMILTAFPIHVFGEQLVNYALGFFPIGIGVAVLRYRLYDVDLIIRRTLVYSILTTLLALIYFGGVALLQLLLPSLTGQATSQLVIVLSTLAIAALFLPLRQRVQTFIDRRFYRRRYDAARILSEFAAATRDDPDIDRLTASLVEVVNTALQTESVGVWLRSETNSGPQHPASGG
jgi:hypothetical protein